MLIKVLGSVEVERDGQLLNIGGPQQRRLLAFLVIHRGVSVSTDRIIEALWDEGEVPDGAARSMRTYISFDADVHVASPGSGARLGDPPELGGLCARPAEC